MSDKADEGKVETVIGICMVISFCLIGGLGGWWLMGGPIFDYLLYGSGAFVGVTTALWAMYLAVKA